MSEMSEVEGMRKPPEERYSYYRRCRVFRRSGEQCKAPAEKGAHICYAHAGQRAMVLRRERERRAVLEEAAARMRRRGRPDFRVADIALDFNAIQVTLAVMAQALIDGKIDCKTAGRLAVDLQTASKLLWMIQRKARKTLPLINADDTDSKELPTPEGSNLTTETRRCGEQPGLPQIAKSAGNADVAVIRRTQELTIHLETNIEPSEQAQVA